MLKWIRGISRDTQFQTKFNRFNWCWKTLYQRWGRVKLRGWELSQNGRRWEAWCRAWKQRRQRQTAGWPRGTDDAQAPPYTDTDQRQQSGTIKQKSRKTFCLKGLLFRPRYIHTCKKVMWCAFPLKACSKSVRYNLILGQEFLKLYMKMSQVWDTWRNYRRF